MAQIRLNKKNAVISVYTHADGTVSVGFSGESGQWENFKNQLQIELDSYAKNKYIVSNVVAADLLDNMTKGVPDKGNKKGVCAVPKAATAAHDNPSPITGMDTRHRLVVSGEYATNPHPYTGEGKTSNSQMDPCNTCKLYEKEYMEYANKNKKSNKCSS